MRDAHNQVGHLQSFSLELVKKCELTMFRWFVLSPTNLLPSNRKAALRRWELVKAGDRMVSVWTRKELVVRQLPHILRSRLEL